MRCAVKAAVAGWQKFTAANEAAAAFNARGHRKERRPLSTAGSQPAFRTTAPFYIPSCSARQVRMRSDAKDVTWRLPTHPSLTVCVKDSRQRTTRDLHATRDKPQKTSNILATVFIHQKSI